jgi:hypothetical protein
MVSKRFGLLHLQRIHAFVKGEKHLVTEVNSSPMSLCQFSLLFKSCATCATLNGPKDHGFACVA